MADRLPNVPFQRYADDIIVHCASQKQAEYIVDLIKKRLKVYNLELNLKKTKIVYAGKYNDYDHEGYTIPKKFTFLG